MKKNLGIQVTSYFSEESWLKSLGNYDLSSFETFFFTSDKDFFNIIDKIDFAFILNFKEKYLSEISNLKMLYIGVSDIDYLDRLSFPEGIEINFSRGISSKYIAEYNLLASLTLIRNFKSVFTNQINSKWDQEPFLSSSLDSIKDHKIGIIGMGNNGKATGQIFSNLGCQISYLSREKVKTQFNAHYFPFKNLKSFLSNNDIIILTIPLRDNTFNLIGREQLISMGSDSYLINSSRGEIVDESSLIEFLEKGQIRGAALDVSSIETMKNSKWYKPFDISRETSPLWNVKNLLITPHVAGSANNLVKPIQQDFIKKVLKHHV